MDELMQLWKSFVNSGAPELYLLYRQAATDYPPAPEWREYVHQDRSHRAPRGGDQ